MILKLQNHLQEAHSEQLELLRKSLKGLDKVCIAYSGGVDSALLAALAQEQLGSNALAITGVSDSLAPYLREEAKQQASWIGIRHQECFTKEIEDQNYSSNPINRCFACKAELYNHLTEIAKLSGDYQVIDGVNFDDLGDHRPGIDAARLAKVRSPLVELKITKVTVRQISKALGLPWWDKPSQPCLASRFPYGEEITSRRLQQIAKAEEWLINNGFRNLRVRVQGLSARIELPADSIDKFMHVCNRKELVSYFISIGFSTVSLDLEGLISGKLNREIRD